MSAESSAERSDAKITALPGAFSSDHTHADVRDTDRNGVFESLVTGDDDIVGLVAYSIYKQNKHDWLVAFGKSKGRDPQDGEVAAYIIGESTPRRLATYRHLAEATLEGRGPTSPAGAAGDATRNYAIAARRTPATPTAATANWGVIGLIGLAIVAVIGIYLAARAGMIAPSK